MNRDQFNILIDRYEKPVISLVQKMVFSWETARDIAQESFIKLWNKKDILETDHPIYSFLYRIAINLSIDHLRKSRPVALDQPSDLSDPDSESDFGGSRELYQLILQNVTRLKPRQRAAFVLRDIEGFDFQEIARMTGMPIANIRSNLYLARKNIRQLLELNYDINQEYLNEM